jgi:hypothetical protein
MDAVAVYAWSTSKEHRRSKGQMAALDAYHKLSNRISTIQPRG